MSYRIQVNSASKELNLGDKIMIIGRGVPNVKNSDIPSLTAKISKDGAPDLYAMVGDQEECKGDDLSDILELVEEYPVLKEDGESDTTGKLDGPVGVIVQIAPTERWFTGYVIEIPSKSDESVSLSGDMQVFDLTIKGSITANMAKTDVIRDFNDGEDVSVTIQLNESGEPSVVYPKNAENHSGNKITAGEIKYKDGQKEDLMKILIKKSLNGKVYKVEGAAYRVKAAIDNEEYEAILQGKTIETIEEVKESIHVTVGTPMETLNDIHAYLSSQAIGNKQIKSLLKKIRNYDDSVVAFIPHKPKTAYQDNKKLLKRAIAYLLGGESVLMSGDAATGKNLMAETLCWIVQKPYRFYSINIQTDKFDLTGRTVLQSQQNGGGTSVQDSFLVQMMKHGGAILLDEMNASNPAVMTVLHSVAEKGHKMIDIESSDERVVALNDFVLFGAMNPGYAGTGDLNEALHSRFATLNFGNNEQIIDLLKVHHESKDAPEAMMNQVNKLYSTLYGEVKDGAISAKVLSFRRYAAAVKYASEGILSLKEALIDNVANMVLDESENEIIRDAIDSHIR